MSKTSQEVSAQIASLREKELVSRILLRLSDELSPDLYYHSVAHTEDVLQEAITFGVHDGLVERELELLAIAACYHDAGFIGGKNYHEVISASMAEIAMKESSEPFDKEEIQTVRQMIIDTKIIDSPSGKTQVPKTRLSKYLLDADLANYGREDFFTRLDLITKELNVNRDDFLKQTLKSLKAHRWHTPAAKSLRENQKQANISTLEKMIQKNNYE